MSGMDGWNIIDPPHMTDAERDAAFDDPEWIAERDATLARRDV